MQNVQSEVGRRKPLSRVAAQGVIGAPEAEEAPYPCLTLNGVHLTFAATEVFSARRRLCMERQHIISNQSDDQTSPTNQYTYQEMSILYFLRPSQKTNILVLLYYKSQHVSAYALVTWYLMSN